MLSIALRNTDFFMKDTAQTKKRYFFPIRVKTILLIVVFGLVLAEVAMVYFSISSSNQNKKTYLADATDLSETVAVSVDIDKFKHVKDEVAAIYDSYDTKLVRDDYDGTPEFEEYLAKFDAVRNLQDYKDLQQYLATVKSVNDDTESVYLCYVDYELGYGIYLVYDQENEWFPTGIIDYIYEEDYPMLEDPMIGFKASIYMAEVEQEYLVTAGTAIVDPTTKDVIGYAMVDITMNTVRKSQADRIVRLFIYLISTVLVLCGVGILVINFILIKPVKTLQNAAKSYDVNDPEKTHEIFSKLHVNVHDEFTDLADSMKQMESDINNKIIELMRTNEALYETKQVASEMTELANKDGLTGVRNKIAYDNQCHQMNKDISGNKLGYEFGIVMVDLNYLKNINDDYGHDSGDAALIKLCNIICTIFAHSSVYRIGGDEFVVILKGRDYKNSKKLIDEFNAKIEELNEDIDLLPAEKVSAAIGYSTFNPKKDTCVDDVFKRADKAMYTRKHEMKERDKSRQ